MVARDGGQESGAVTANGDRFPFGVKKMSWNQTDVRLHKRGDALNETGPLERRLFTFKRLIILDMNSSA